VRALPDLPLAPFKNTSMLIGQAINDLDEEKSPGAVSTVINLKVEAP
jgi:hypothetical protein